VLGHLLTQRRLDDVLGELLQQPIRTSSAAASSSADGLDFPLLESLGFTSLSVAVITTPSPPDTRPGVSGRKHR
jgi:hypothetical protein